MTGKANSVLLSRSTFSSMALLAACSAALAGTPTPFAPAESGIVILRNATLIDGTSAPPRPGMAVVIDGPRIKAVLPDAELTPALSTGAKLIDLSGHYLLPGLVDSHVHLATPPNRRQAESVLRRDLYGGVTAVRDMADDLRSLGDITRASLVGEMPAPDIYYAALMAGPGFFTDKRTVQVTAGATPGQVPWMQAVTDQTNLPLAVARARGTYATALKLYADLSAGLVRRIVAEAHHQHMLAWAHATVFPAKPSEVVAAGIDTISHSCLLIHEASKQVPADVNVHDEVGLDQFKGGRSPVLAKLFRDMVRRGTILDATIWVYAEPAESNGQLTSRCDDKLGGEITGQAWRAGVQISAGTDAVATDDELWPDLFHELDALVREAGMPPAAAIHSATLISARAAGQQRDMGSIEPGKLANLIVLARNPLEDIDNLKSVEQIVKRGRFYLRSDFVPLVKGDVTDF